jgi:hypothetical protein
MWPLFYTKFIRCFVALQDTETGTGTAGTQENMAGGATLPVAGRPVIVIADVKWHAGGGHFWR